MTLSFRIDGGDYDSAGLATRRLKEQLAKVGVSAPVMRRAMIACYEAEMNVVIHARTGTLWARLERGRLDLEVADEGPGIPDVALALREGWSTASTRAREMGFGAGMGLPNIRRSSDQFDIETRVGRGTRVRSTIVLDAATVDPPPANGTAETLSPGIHAARCRRCMRCLLACPSLAIRVGVSGPSVIDALCVGCASCIGQCADGVYGLRENQGASDATAVPVDKDAVLVLPRGFLSGFPVDHGPARVAAALHQLGYRDVRLLEDWIDVLRRRARQEALAAAVSGASALPIIVPLCPPVVSLVQSRFPSLIPQLGPWLSPVEAAGEEFPLRPVTLVAACPGQHAAACRRSLTGRLTVISPTRLAEAVRPLLVGSSNGRSAENDDATGNATGTDDRAADCTETMTVHGQRHVLRVLAEAEAGRLNGVSVLDLSLCEGGCSGSPLLTSDWILSERQWLAAPRKSVASSDASAVIRSKPYSQRLGVRLDPDMVKAMEKLARIDALTRTLPGRDCGACGAPTCAAFAEDLVVERAGAMTCPHAEETT